MMELYTEEVFEHVDMWTGTEWRTEAVRCQDGGTTESGCISALSM
jgi:hypothetical protein